MDKATATEMAKDFVLSGMLIDSKEKGGDAVRTVIDTANAIFAENAETIREAIDRFVDASNSDDDSKNTVDDVFLNSFLPIHYRVLYEAYAPYWLLHCHQDASDAEYTYYNDLIEMYWSWKDQVWKKKDGTAVTIMLPPTKGLVDLAYKEDIGSFDIYRRKTAAEQVDQNNQTASATDITKGIAYVK